MDGAIRRYERGESQPTLDVIGNQPKAVRVKASMLVFGEVERGPDEELRFQFKAVSRLDQDATASFDLNREHYPAPLRLAALVQKVK